MKYSAVAKLMGVSARVKQMQTLRDDAEAAYKRGDFAAMRFDDSAADFIEDELRDLAYTNACESDSPNSPDFTSTLIAELKKLGVEE